MPSSVITPCKDGFHRRRSYTVKRTGKPVPSRCVKNPRAVRSSTRKLKCPPGKIRRASYTRHISSSVLAHGYSVHKKNGKTYRVYPKKRGRTRVRSACVDGAAVQKSVPRIRILHRGALKKYGYSYKLPVAARQSALKKAIAVYGALNVYHKLDAVAKLAVRSAPAASRAFRADSEWVRRFYKKT